MRARCAQRGGLGCLHRSGFSSRRRVALLREAGGTRGADWRGGMQVSRLSLAVSQSLLFGLARGAHRRLRLETNAAVLLTQSSSDVLAALVENEPAHSSPKSFTGAVVLTSKSAIT